MEAGGPARVVESIWAARAAQDDTYWAMADLCAAFKGVYATGPEFRQLYGIGAWKWLSSETGWSPRSLSNLALTAEVFPTGERVLGDHVITYHHHRICATLAETELEAREWLDRAMKEDWSTAQLAKAMRGDEPKEKCELLERRWCNYWTKHVEADECEGCPQRTCGGASV